MKVQPITDIRDIKRIKKNLRENSRNLLLFVMGINSGLRVQDLLSLRVDDVRHASVGDRIEIIEKKTGKANVLIFPDLNSANITLKMVQMLADVNTYGQILTGLTKPAALISRGSSATDIYGTMVVSAAQAVDRRFLFPKE